MPDFAGKCQSACLNVLNRARSSTFGLSLCLSGAYVGPHLSDWFGSAAEIKILTCSWRPGRRQEAVCLPRCAETGEFPEAGRPEAGYHPEAIDEGEAMAKPVTFERVKNETVTAMSFSKITHTQGFY